jgi:hypothetical protein
MRDRPVIVAGLIAFLAAVTFPVWYNVAARTAAAAPVLARPSDAAIARVRSVAVVGSGFPGIAPGAARVCVAPRDDMRASHMQLIASWRDDVVRRNDRAFAAYDGYRYEKNLIATCLGCHDNRAQFCDRCHDYAGVAPGCWDCHQK